MRRHFLVPKWRPVVALVVLIILPAVHASAQSGGSGLRAGVSGSPDQFYFGAHLDTGQVIERLSFRPNVEVGVGNDVTTITGNFEFAFWFPLRRHPVSIYAGGGPAVNFYRFGNGASHTATEPGFNLLVGVAHSGGLFGELKIGLLDSPEVKVGVGYSWR